jgi:formylglycine-generating enzyme required for sulfatase activity
LTVTNSTNETKTINGTSSNLNSDGKTVHVDVAGTINGPAGINITEPPEEKGRATGVVVSEGPGPGVAPTEGPRPAVEVPAAEPKREEVAIKPAPTIPPSPTPPPVELPAGLTLKVTDLPVVLIPRGSFLMGSPEEVGFPNEHPRHEVTIAQPSYLGLTEVTQAQ